MLNDYSMELETILSKDDKQSFTDKYNAYRTKYINETYAEIISEQNPMHHKIINFIETNKAIIDPQRRENQVNDLLKVTTESFFKSILNLIQSVESENVDAINRAAEDFGSENKHNNNKRLSLRFDQKEINAIINLISKYLESKNNPSKEIIIEKIRNETRE
jgi:hypothetical protein